MKFINWLIQSSTDTKKLALTIKGLIIGAIPMIIFIAKVSGIAVIEGDITTLAGIVENAIIAFLTFVSAVITLYGFVRKIYMTYFYK